jgi:hypothetical protein
LETSHTQLEDEATLFQTNLLQRFDEKSRKIVDQAQTMETIFQDPVDDFGDKTDLVDDLVMEVKYLSHENVSLKTKNAGLENQLKIAENVFQTIVIEHSRKVTPRGTVQQDFYRLLQTNLRRTLTFLKTWRKK